MAAGGGQQAGVGQGMYQSGWRSMAEEVLFGPVESRSKDQLLVHYELMGTITLVFMVALDFFHCVGHATFGNLFLLMDSSVMLACAMMVADVHLVRKCNPFAPGSAKLGFALFWLLVARLCYLFPTFIVHCARGNLRWIVDALNVGLSGVNAVALFRAYSRLQVLEDEERKSTAQMMGATFYPDSATQFTGGLGEVPRKPPKKPSYGATAESPLI